MEKESSKSPNSYKVFTTFDGINLPCFALSCLFGCIFNNLNGKGKQRKMCRNKANQSISGGKIHMIKSTFCVPRQHAFL